MCYHKMDKQKSEDYSDYCDVFPSRDRIMLRTVKFMDFAGADLDRAPDFEVQYAVVTITADQARQLAEQLLAVAGDETTSLKAKV